MTGQKWGAYSLHRTICKFDVLSKSDSKQPDTLGVGSKDRIFGAEIEKVAEPLFVFRKPGRVNLPISEVGDIFSEQSGRDRQHGNLL